MTVEIPTNGSVGAALDERGAAVLSAQSLSKTFHRRRARDRADSRIYAVRDVSLAIPRMGTLGLVGESGSGKSTLARLLMRLIQPTGGVVTLLGRDLTKLKGERLRQGRRDMQMVFQDPYASLDPRVSVMSSIVEPLQVHGIGARSSRLDTARDAMARVGLTLEFAARFPHELSGGQRQRVAIARALALQPKVLILDEPLSALDVSIQAQVLNLLIDLQGADEMSYLFISHDIQVVRHLADEVAVMYRGRIVESGSKLAVLTQPRHPYTQELLRSVPVAHPRLRRAESADDDGSPDFSATASGCPFRLRCRFAQDLCSEVAPPLEEKAPAHLAACHFDLEEVTVRRDE